MGNVIDKLLQDHKNIYTLLGLLEQQVRHFTAGEYADYQILTDIMHYFVHQPDVYHHPHEDIIFAALKRKDLGVANRVDEITAEHEIMAKTSATIYDEIIQIQGNAIFSRSEIAQRLKDFIARYYVHITKEETELFVLANNTLNASDWHMVDVEIGNHDDPLFGKALSDEYRALYKAILSEARESLRTDTGSGC